MLIRKGLLSWSGVLPALTAAAILSGGDVNAQVRRSDGSSVKTAEESSVEAEEEAPPFIPRTKKNTRDKEKKAVPGARSKKSGKSGKYQVIGTPAEGGIVGQYTPG